MVPLKKEMMMTDIQKNELVNEIMNACDVLAGLESIANDAGSPVESQARGMLDALEAHLRILTPEVYS